jgi:hypothetical protein
LLSAPAGNLQTSFGPAEGSKRDGKILWLCRAAFAEERAGTLERLPGALSVDLVCSLCGIGEHDDVIWQHFEEAARDGYVLDVIADTYSQIAGLKHSQQGRVPRQDAKLSLDSRGIDGVDFPREHRAFRRDDVESQSRHVTSPSGSARRHRRRCLP